VLPRLNFLSKKKKDDEVVKHYVGLDEGKNRLLLFRSASDVEEEVIVKKSLLKHHANLVIHTGLVDQHLYLFSHWILDLLKDKTGISSIQAELLPYLISNQFTDKGRTFAQSYETKDNTSLTSRARLMSHGPARVKSAEAFRCYALIADEPSYGCRANTVKSFTRMNFDMASGATFQYTPWRPLKEDNQRDKAVAANPTATIGDKSIVGRNLEAGDGSSVKKSVVGSNVKIGSGVKISNSIIFDNVVIEKDVTITNSIVCRGATVDAKTVLKDCQVAAGYSVTGNNEYRNETLVGAGD